MTKQDLLSKLLSRVNLSAIITIVVLLIGLVAWLVTLDSRLEYIEKDHQQFGHFFQTQIDELKASILRQELKIDKIGDRLLIKWGGEIWLRKNFLLNIITNR